MISDISGEPPALSSKASAFFAVSSAAFPSPMEAWQIAMVSMQEPCPEGRSWFLKNSQAMVASVSAAEESPDNCRAWANSSLWSATACSSSSSTKSSITSRCFWTTSSGSPPAPFATLWRSTSASNTFTSASSTLSVDPATRARARWATSSASAKLPSWRWPMATARSDDACARGPPNSACSSAASFAAFKPSRCFPNMYAEEATKKSASPSKWRQEGRSCFRDACTASRPILQASSCASLKLHKSTLPFRTSAAARPSLSALLSKRLCAFSAASIASCALLSRWWTLAMTRVAAASPAWHRAFWKCSAASPANSSARRYSLMSSAIFAEVIRAKAVPLASEAPRYFSRH
mmetsp:Transcript_44527/g.129470  ORF Transcript_44527/g.129470 Transcript_44527/m.129470 type:complete len:350 (+) Transcript_44527:337-1386(+)